MRRKLSIFDTLGTRTTDDLVTIRQAWRRKVKTLHPDLVKDQDKSAACAALVTVNAAFDALRDHKPFADRRVATRRSDRRKSGNRSRVWTKAERQNAARKQANNRSERGASDAGRAAPHPQPTAQKTKNGFFAAKERARQADIARRNAAALAQREEAVRAVRAAKRAKEAEELRARTARKNAEAARKAQSNMAGANQIQKSALAALRGYADSLNAFSADTRRPKSVRLGL